MSDIKKYLAAGMAKQLMGAHESSGGIGGILKKVLGK